MRRRLVALAILLAMSCSAALVSIPAAAAVSNDTADTASPISSYPASVTTNLALAVTSSPARAGCQLDAFYSLAVPSASQVAVTVSGGGKLILLPGTAVANWDTAPAIAEIVGTSTVNAWATPALLVLCSTGVSGQSVTFTIEGVPDKPVLLSTTTGNQTITVNWAYTLAPNASLSQFSVLYRSASSGPTWSTTGALPGTRTSVTISGLTNLQMYEVVVRATSTSGIVTESAVVTIIVGKPNRPPEMIALPEAGGIRVRWAPSTEADIATSLSVTVDCGAPKVTKVSSGNGAGEFRFGGIDTARSCTTTGFWRGSLGNDGPVTTLPALSARPYPALVGSAFVRKDGLSIFQFGTPDGGIPTEVRVSSYNVSVACISPTFTFSGIVNAPLSSYTSPNMALGATCSGSVTPRYTDENNQIWSGPGTNVANTRLQEAPAAPTLVATSGNGEALQFQFSPPGQVGREPDTVTVTQTFGGQTLGVFTLARGQQTLTVPVNESYFGQSHEFSAVARNSAGTSSTTVWRTTMPSRPETPPVGSIASFLSTASGSELVLNLRVAINGSRPWMQDPLAKYVITLANAVSGEKVVKTFDVIGTTEMKDLGRFSPSITASVVVQTALGAAPPVVLKLGSETIQPPTSGSIKTAETRALTVQWIPASSDAAALIRLEVYDSSGAYIRTEYAPAPNGKTTIENLDAESDYRIALYTSVGGVHSLQPLIIEGSTLKGATPKPVVTTKPVAPTKPTTQSSKPKTTPSRGVKVTGKITLKKSIVCVKGTQKRTVTGTNPKCPTGWKKK